MALNGVQFGIDAVYGPLVGSTNRFLFVGLWFAGFFFPRNASKNISLTISAIVYVLSFRGFSGRAKLTNSFVG